MNLDLHNTVIQKIIILHILSLLFTSNVDAVNFYSINKLYGISMREAYSVCEDNEGFIWISTKTGILRLTNNDHRIYSLPYESENVLTVKLAYENSKLIAYTFNGQVFIYDPIFDRFDLFFFLGKALNNNFIRVQNVTLDDSGVYWIASSVGLFQYKSEKLTFICELSDFRHTMSWYDRQNLLIVKPDGIWLFNIYSLKLKLVYSNDEIDPFEVSSLYLDKNKDILWMGTLSNGLYSYSFRSGILTRILKDIIPEQSVLAIEANSDSTILIGIDGQGIWELNENGDHVLNLYKENLDDTYSLRGNGVYDLFCDSNNRVWICTYSGGASFFDQENSFITQIIHEPNNVNSLVNNEVNSIIEDKWGKLWFATNNGLCSWDVASNRWKSYYTNMEDHSQVFLSLFEDEVGRIWAGTYSYGVYIIDGKTGKEIAHYFRDDNEMSVVGNFIFEIFQDSQGDIWLGSCVDEVVCYQTKKNKFKVYSKESISSMDELFEKKIVLGCSTGLSILNKETGEIKSLLADVLINDILVIDDIIWLCTRGDGLIKYHYKVGTFEKFTEKSGLPSDYVNSIVFSDDFLWLGTEKGLCSFNPENNAVATFPSISSLSGISFNNGAGIVLKNGKLCWGTNNGAVFCDTVPETKRKILGRIFLQDILISGRSVREIPEFKLNSPVDRMQSLKLKYTQKNLNLELLPLSTFSDVKFSWKMDGFDEDWSIPKNNRIVTYTNIPSGEFQLKIRLYDSSLSQIIAERSLLITLVPPFWQKMWFFVLVIAFIGGIIFLYYVNRLKQIHAGDKVRFFTNTAHDIRTSLTLIKGPIEELGKKSLLSGVEEKYLNLAREQVRRLSSVVTQLMDFQKIDIGKEQLAFTMVDVVALIKSRVVMFESVAKTTDIDLIFTSNRNIYKTAIDEGKIEKVTDNLISNALKYSHPKSKVIIDLKCYNNEWVFRVTDYGIGISKKAQRKIFKEFYRSDNAINAKIVGSGIGLLLAKNYISLHKGTISCNSKENEGSIFEVNLPYKLISESSISDKSENSQLISKEELKTWGQDIAINVDSSKRNMKILIVEDNEKLIDFMNTALSKEFKIFTAVDGKDAWKLIIKRVPDLVISDIMMPRMDGFELCELIKSTYETSHIPVILLTSLTEKTDQIRGLGLGADDYITKPFDLNILIHKIRTIIRNREVLKDKALKLVGFSSNEPITDNEHNDKFLKKLMEVAKANIANSNFDREEFAAEMNMSRSILYSKVKSLTDLAPSDFIRTIRLNHAAELLKTKKYSVTEVSELCGFTSVAYFSTTFRKFFGKSPTDYIS